MRLALTTKLFKGYGQHQIQEANMLDKVDPLKGPITRPVVVRQEEGDEQAGTHQAAAAK
jgi:hypothetical protein